MNFGSDFANVDWVAVALALCVAVDVVGVLPKTNPIKHIQVCKIQNLNAISSGVHVTLMSDFV